MYEVCWDFLWDGGGKRYGYDDLDEANEYAEARWDELDDDGKARINAYVVEVFKDGYCDTPSHGGFDSDEHMTEEAIEKRWELGLLSIGEANELRHLNGFL